MLKLYGTSKSRSARSLWALEELDLKYEHIPTAISQAKSSDHLTVNPNGHLPAIDDDGSIIWESMAINLYLAEKYGSGSLWPTSVEDHGHAYKWSFFGMTEMESHLLGLLIQRVIVPAEKRDEKVAQRAIDALKAPLAVLDGALQGKDCLICNSFTIADLHSGQARHVGDARYPGVAAEVSVTRCQQKSSRFAVTRRSIVHVREHLNSYINQEN